MNLNDDVVYRCLRLGPLHQRHPGRSRSLVRHHDRLHGNCLLGHLSLASTSSSPVPQIRATVVGCWHPTSANASPEQHPSGKARVSWLSKPVTISRRLVAPLNWPYSKVIKCRFVVSSRANSSDPYLSTI